MSDFRLPPPSPMMGSKETNIIQVATHNKVSIRHYPKILNARIIVMFASLFHWWDKNYFNRKIEGFVFKKSPLFVIGHWGSGTTLLQNILAKDPDFGYATTYYSVFPYNLRSKWIFKNFMRFLMPDYIPRNGVKISADLPQKDEHVLISVCKSTINCISNLLHLICSNFGRWTGRPVQSISKSDAFVVFCFS